MFKFLWLGMIFFHQPLQASEFIVWNVGQGLWTTEIHPDSCFHMDMGGERNPTSKVLKLCRSKMNYIYLSHWDWDHISFASQFAQKVSRVCLIRKPDGQPSPYKLKLIGKIPLCSKEQASHFQNSIQILFDPYRVRQSNDRSDILYSKNFQILMPGDSPRNQEKIWQDLTPSQTSGLILGHHGSRTSTSTDLLQQMSRLSWAVASARSKRYRHPHTEVVERLKKFGVALIKTEDWGDLHFIKKKTHTRN